MLCWLNRNKTLYDLIQWFPQVLEAHCMLESFGKLLKHHNAQAVSHSNQITISGSGWDLGMNFFLTSYAISYIEFVKTLLRYSKPYLGLFLKVCSSVNTSHILETVLSTSFWVCFLIYLPSPYWKHTPDLTSWGDLIPVTNLNAAASQRGRYLICVHLQMPLNSTSWKDNRQGLFLQ